MVVVVVAVVVPSVVVLVLMVCCFVLVLVFILIVSYRSLKRHGDRLEPPMRMPSHAPGILSGFRRLEFLRRRVVEHQEGTQFGRERLVREDGVDVEAVADPVFGCGEQDLIDGAQRHGRGEGLGDDGEENDYWDCGERIEE